MFYYDTMWNSGDYLTKVKETPPKIYYQNTSLIEYLLYIDKTFLNGLTVWFFFAQKVILIYHIQIHH